jgi:6-phosphogluconolactonase
MITSEVIHTKNMDEYGTIISHRIIDILSRAIKKQGKSFLAVSGGNTPLPIYKKLINSKYQNALDWSKVHLFFIDERCVSKNDKENNFKACYDSLLYQYPDIKYYRIKGWHNAKEAASKYQDKIRSVLITRNGLPQFDLIFMGMGEDGHIASIFPDSTYNNNLNSLVESVYVKSKNAQRITMTIPVLNNARHRIIGAIGEKKKRIISDLKQGNYNNYPIAKLLNSRSDDLWVIN